MPGTCPKRRPECLLATLLLVAGCSESRIPVAIPFEAAFDGQSIDCSSSPIALTDLRLYLSEISAEMSEGGTVDVPFVVDEAWQSASVALIDLESGEGACTNGTLETNAAVRLLWPEGDIDNLVMTIGVPFDVNHADPLMAAPPLDDSAMHWHWRSGYKFLRSGIETPDDGFWLHLGSTGCEGTTGNITACGQPNRVTVSLDGFVAGRSAIVLHLDRLFESVDLEDGVKSDCSSGPLETSCTGVLRTLGLGDGTASDWITLETR